MSQDDVESAREEMQSEFEQFRKQFGKVLEAVQSVGDAGPDDDIHGLLKRLEETVEEVRDGGMVGSGAKGHREAREKYRKLAGLPD
jgi:hypothetical protein